MLAGYCCNVYKQWDNDRLGFQCGFSNLFDRFVQIYKYIRKIPLHHVSRDSFCGIEVSKPKKKKCTEVESHIVI